MSDGHSWIGSAPSKVGIIVIDPELATVQDVNPYSLGMTGFALEDLVGNDSQKAGAVIGLASPAQSLEAPKHSEAVRYDD